MRNTLSIVAALCFALAFAPAARAGLVGYWSFDADNANDASANANNGTAGGSLTFETDTPAAVGGGKSLQSHAGGGAANVLTVPTSTSLEAIDDSFSLSYWMKSNLADNGNWVRLFQHGTEANGDQSWMVNRNSGNNDVNVRVDTTSHFNQNIAVGGPAVFDGTWHHVVFTADSGVWTKYEDGALTGLGTYDHVAGLSNTRDLYMFGRNGTGEYVGFLDEVALYDQALSRNQAADLAAGGDPMNLASQFSPPIGIGPTGGNGVFGIREVKDNGTIGSVGAALASLQSGGGTIVDGTAPVINFHDADGGGGNGHVGGDSLFLSDAPGGQDDFVQLAQGTIKIDTPGRYTFYARGDDGFALRVLGQSFVSASDNGDGTAVAIDDTLLNDALGGNVNGFGVIDLAAGEYDLEYLFFERGGGAYDELFAAFGEFTAYNATDFHLIGDVQNGGLALVEPSAGEDVPEPATLALLGLAACGLGRYLRRRRTA